MSGKIYALLVGINEYAPQIGALTGCVNDVDHFQAFLKSNYDPNSLCIEVLKNSEATKANIIQQFRNHLAKAKSDDIALFQFCGHGAQSKSAREFLEFYPDGKDEGLVCVDSRITTAHDLADKELAILIQELSKNDPHICVLFDCCHSGSGTRTADDITQLRARQTHEVFEERPLQTYLEGQFSALQQSGKSLSIPASRHILLAACKRTQKAWEARDHRGVFTSTLLDVLQDVRADITYADLFVECRARVRKFADNQDPQFETYGRFVAHGGFLGAQAKRKTPTHSVYFEANDWMVDCGAIHRIPTDSNLAIELAVYTANEPRELVGNAELRQVGAQKSIADLDFVADPHEKYEAEIATLPAAPLLVPISGDQQALDVLKDLQTSQGQAAGVACTEEDFPGARYAVTAANDQILIRHVETGEILQGVKGDSKEAASYIFDVLEKIAKWERALELQNQSTKLKQDDVQVTFCESKTDGTEIERQATGEILIDIEKIDGSWSEVTGKLKVSNRASQPLHLTLFYIGNDFSIQPVYNEPIGKGQTVTVTPNGETEIVFFLEDNEDEAEHAFKLLVSTEKVDDFLLQQSGIELGTIVDLSRMSGNRSLKFGRKTRYKNEWFTKDLNFRLVRRHQNLGDTDTPLLNGHMTIKANRAVRAAVHLSTASTLARNVSHENDFCKALQRQGFEPLRIPSSGTSISGSRTTRGTDDGVATVLEISDFQNSENLSQHPVRIDLDVDLSENEFILPLAFDGEHVLIAGESFKDDAGMTHVTVRDIPEPAISHRSLTKALKLYFFKTYLGRDNLNRLCWVEYHDDGNVTRHADGVAEKVADAQNVLLLLHGIIGDTAGIAKGLRMAVDSAGNTIDKKFDLVLSYDYENLSTSIAETAMTLKRQLRDVGLHENDDRRLTLVVHSMGGLVSRWLIEREDGDKIVDHLVMFGTPNGGSPFGQIDDARQLFTILTTVAINFVPGLAVFGAGLLSLLFRSKNVTPTLEQMDPDSEFMKTLNASDDPRVRYTIVAGDVRNYEEESDALTARVVTKIGGGILFESLYKQASHDIAVSEASILNVHASRVPAPTQHKIVCHHLNYFTSQAGLRALSNVNW